MDPKARCNIFVQEQYLSTKSKKILNKKKLKSKDFKWIRFYGCISCIQTEIAVIKHGGIFKNIRIFNEFNEDMTANYNFFVIKIDPYEDILWNLVFL